MSCRLNRRLLIGYPRPKAPKPAKLQGGMAQQVGYRDYWRPRRNQQGLRMPDSISRASF